MHHNFIHHNQYNGLGYGVCHGSAYSLIEANLFDANRHSIAGTGVPKSEISAPTRISLTSTRLHGAEIECPVHGARFDARSGSVMCGPARRGLRVFPLTRVSGGVEVSLE